MLERVHAVRVHAASVYLEITHGKVGRSLPVRRRADHCNRLHLAKHRSDVLILSVDVCMTNGGMSSGNISIPRACSDAVARCSPPVISTLDDCAWPPRRMTSIEGADVVACGWTYTVTVIWQTGLVWTWGPRRNKPVAMQILPMASCKPRGIEAVQWEAVTSSPCTRVSPGQFLSC